MLSTAGIAWAAGVRATPRTLEGRRLWRVFAVVLLGAFGYLMWVGRGNSFYFDEWGWLEQRSSGLAWLIRPYNQHLQIVPLAVYQLLFHTVGLGQYWVFRLIQTSVHLGTVAIIFEFARRRLGWLAVALVLPVAVLGGGWDYVLWPVSMGFVASIGLGIGALLALERGDRRGDLSALALLTAGLVCCEFAAFFAVGVAVETVYRDRSVRRAWVWAIPLALYGLWWLGYQGATGASHNLGAAPAFFTDLAASGIQGLLGLYAVPRVALLIAGLLVLGWHVARTRALSPRAAALLATIGVFWLAVAVSRAHMASSDATRYVYTSAILLVLLVAELCRGSSIRPWGLGLAGLFVVLALHGNLGVLHAAEGTLRTASQQVSAELGALEVAQTTAPAGLVVDPRYAPVLFAGPYLTVTDQLHSSAADTPFEILRAPETARVAADRLLVRAGDVRVTSAAPGYPHGSRSPAALAPPPAAGSGGSSTAHGSCLRFRPTALPARLDVILPARGVVVRAGVGAPVEVQLRRFAAGFELAPVVTVTPRATTSFEPAPDGSSLPWHVRILARQPVEVCAAP